MKSLFKFLPEYELVWPALFSTLTGLMGTYAVVMGGLHPLFLIITIPLLIFGVMMWKAKRWAVQGGLVWFALSFVLRLVGLFFDFQWKHLAYTVCFGSFAYTCWDALRQMKLEEILGRRGDLDGEEDEDDKALISFVLLQREPKYLEDRVLAKMVESAWGGEYTNEDEELNDGFVVGDNPTYILQAPYGMFLVHNFDCQYWDNTEEVLEDIGEYRLLKSVEKHQAWLSVDMINPGSEKEPHEFYPRIIQLIMELADEDTLVIMRPDTSEVNVWSEELAERMTAPDAYKEFAQGCEAPVINVKDDDPLMLEAVATAKKRWPEFAEAFKVRDPDDDSFVAKVKISVEDSTEFIWMNVIGIEPRFLHGKLANEPVSLGELQLGSQVEVPMEDLSDWCFVKDGEPVGLFSLEAVSKAQERRFEPE